MLDTRLPGVALIIGVTTGIGRGSVPCFLEAGCTKLFLGDVKSDGLESFADELTRSNPTAEIDFEKVDISDEKSIQNIVDRCVARFGRIDYAINIAGVVPSRQSILDVEAKTYDWVMDINEYGTWMCHRAQVRQMLSQEPLPDHGNIRGSIVSVSSLAGLNASSGMSTYCASKHAIVGFVKTDAQDYGPDGIRVNCIAPGLVDTELFRTTSPPGAAESMIEKIPLRRLGSPKDIGNVMVWLSCRAASFLTGTVIPVDGGFILRRQGM